MNHLNHSVTLLILVGVKAALTGREPVQCQQGDYEYAATSFPSSTGNLSRRLSMFHYWNTENSKGSAQDEKDCVRNDITISSVVAHEDISGGAAFEIVI